MEVMLIDATTGDVQVIDNGKYMFEAICRLLALAAYLIVDTSLIVFRSQIVLPLHSMFLTPQPRECQYHL